MTDKDPKDMTASELLREADSNPCSMCHLVMTGDGSCATTGCASWAYRLADKIDAELAEARELSLLRGAELWAKANGWPDFSEGEDFGAWLDRCALPLPLFEGGEPVQFGDSPVGLDGVEKFIFTRSCGGSCQMQDADGNMLTVFPGAFVKRPAPEVLGADGKPVKVGETVYPIDGEWLGIPLEVSGIESPASVKVYLSAGKSWTTFHADSLTHTPPDTQERIDEDARKNSIRYWGCEDFSCDECPALIDGKKPVAFYELDLVRDSCSEAQKLDLLRRQRELDKRTGGE